MSETPANPSDGWLDREHMPFAAALAHCRSGALQEGYAICQQILGQDSDDIDALHLSGLILCQTGNIAVGIERLRRAVSLNDPRPVLHSNLAEALRGSGSLDAAQAGLARCLLRQRRLVEAIAALSQAVALDPGPREAHDNPSRALQAAW